MMYYFVQPGDTLTSISRKILGRGNRWREIADLNQLRNPNLIFVGQRLRLPNSRLNVLAQTSQRIVGLTIEGERSSQVPANIALARGFLFVVFEQLPDVGKSKIIRKVAAIPRDFSLSPAYPLGQLSLADHVLNLDPTKSQFLSASNRPFGAPSIAGQPILLDVSKIRQAGGQIYSVSDVVNDLERFVELNPRRQAQVNRLISTIRSIEGEVLIEGGVPSNASSRLSKSHTAYIRSAEGLWDEFRASRITRDQLQQELLTVEQAYSRARVVGRIGRVVTVFGVVVTVVDVVEASQRSIQQDSFRPISAEAIRVVGGWGAGIGGGKIGFMIGAAFGIETGPGAIVTGTIGAIVFGAAGYLGADWVADYISPN